MIEGDLAERPTYAIAEAARYCAISPQSVARWRAGYTYPTLHGLRRSGPLTGGGPAGLLTFTELIEVAVVAAARKAGVPMRAVRRAITAAQGAYGVERPLMLISFSTDGRELFTRELEAEGRSRYVNLSRFGQVAWEHIRDVLRDLEYDDATGLALRWFPVGRDSPIVIDPQVSFGRPYVLHKGVSTDAVLSRFRARESLEDITEDLDLTRDEAEAALRFELPPAA
jgi:uncharacterized protein (DUF433 family)